MGMKYCKRKIPRFRKFLLKVVISFPVIQENQEECDNEMWSVERSSCTTVALDRFLKKLEIIKNFYQHYLQELIVHYGCFS